MHRAYTNTLKYEKTKIHTAKAIVIQLVIFIITLWYVITW